MSNNIFFHTITQSQLSPVLCSSRSGGVVVPHPRRARQGDGVVGLTRALLAAGAQCVLVSLWPVPDTAVKILFRTFYSSLLQVRSPLSRDSY